MVGADHSVDVIAVDRAVLLRLVTRPRRDRVGHNRARPNRLVCSINIRRVSKSNPGADVQMRRAWKRRTADAVPGEASVRGVLLLVAQRNRMLPLGAIQHHRVEPRRDCRRLRGLERLRRWASRRRLGRRRGGGRRDGLPRGGRDRRAQHRLQLRVDPLQLGRGGRGAALRPISPEDRRSAVEGARDGGPRRLDVLGAGGAVGVLGHDLRERPARGCGSKARRVRAVLCKEEEEANAREQGATHQKR